MLKIRKLLEQNKLVFNVFTPLSTTFLFLNLKQICIPSASVFIVVILTRNRKRSILLIGQTINYNNWNGRKMLEVIKNMYSNSVVSVQVVTSSSFPCNIGVRQGTVLIIKK